MDVNSPDSSFNCYSQRLLNPYRGIINCICYRSAEAVTADGVHWDIYVSNELLRADSPRSQRTQVSDIRYGKWSAADGLRRGPIFPSSEFRAMEDMGATVYEYLLEVHDEVPFAFTDRFELWLLDREHRPLVLLDSATAIDEIDLQQPLRWTPGIECRRSFVSSAAEQLQLVASPGVVTDHLAAYVQACAGDEPAAQLFERQADGSGCGLAGVKLPSSLVNRCLPDEDFPLNLLSLRHHDAAHRQLLGDFIGWQAPWLLLLPTLPQELRARYEEYARMQAVKMVRQHALYPDVVNRQVLEAAQVEVRLRETSAEPQQEELVLSPFYVELDSEA